MIKKFKIKPKKNFQIVKWTYFIIGLILSFSLTIFFFTNGSLKDLIFNNYLIILFPLIIPLSFSFIGLYYFTFYEDHGIVSVHCRCVGLGKFFKSLNKELEIPKEKIENYEIKKTFFSIKKLLKLNYVVNKRNYSKVFNVSMLSSKELSRMLDLLKTPKSAI